MDGAVSVHHPHLFDHIKGPPSHRTRVHSGAPRPRTRESPSRNLPPSSKTAGASTATCLLGLCPPREELCPQPQSGKPGCRQRHNHALNPPSRTNKLDPRPRRNGHGGRQAQFHHRCQRRLRPRLNKQTAGPPTSSVVRRAKDLSRRINVPWQRDVKNPEQEAHGFRVPGLRSTRSPQARDSAAHALHATSSICSLSQPASRASVQRGCAAVNSEPSLGGRPRRSIPFAIRSRRIRHVESRQGSMHGGQQFRILQQIGDSGDQILRTWSLPAPGYGRPRGGIKLALSRWWLSVAFGYGTRRAADAPQPIPPGRSATRLTATVAADIIWSMRSLERLDQRRGSLQPRRPPGLHPGRILRSDGRTGATGNRSARPAPLQKPTD